SRKKDRGLRFWEIGFVRRLQAIEGGERSWIWGSRKSLDDHHAAATFGTERKWAGFLGGGIYRLRMMSGSLSKAMEQGCWCELQGAYFANWNASKMVIPYGMVGAQWWDAPLPEPRLRIRKIE